MWYSVENGECKKKKTKIKKTVDLVYLKEKKNVFVCKIYVEKLFIRKKNKRLNSLNYGPRGEIIAIIKFYS